VSGLSAADLAGEWAGAGRATVAIVLSVGAWLALDAAGRYDHDKGLLSALFPALASALGYPCAHAWVVWLSTDVYPVVLPLALEPGAADLALFARAAKVRERRTARARRSGPRVLLERRERSTLSSIRCTCRACRAGLAPLRRVRRDRGRELRAPDALAAASARANGNANAAAVVAAAVVIVVADDDTVARRLAAAVGDRLLRHRGQQRRWR